MDLEELIKTIKRFNQDTARIARSLAEISKRKAEANENLGILFKHLKSIEVSLPEVKENADWINGLERWQQTFRTDLDNKSQSVVRAFGKDLNSLVSERIGSLNKWRDGLTVSIFELELLTDKRRVRIWYGPKQVRLDEVAMAPEVVAKKLSEKLESLGSGQSTSEFASVLRRAYSRISGIGKQPWVALSEILPEVAFLLQSKAFKADPKRENFRNYSSADFSYDLFRLGSSSEPKNFKLRTATLAKTKSKSGSLWIPRKNNIDGGEHYSDITFTENIK